MNEKPGVIGRRQNMAQVALERGAATVAKSCFRLFGCLLTLSILCSFSFARAGQQAEARKGQKHYACVMHRDVKSDEPGKCPRCKMDLRVLENGGGASPQSSHGGDSESRDTAKVRVPDTIVYDHNGRKLRFYTDLVKGKTVAINFIFTTCTTICPPLAATFRKVQQQLTGRIGRDVALISISVDPVIDVPERLKAYAAKFNAGPGWTFVTGSKSDIEDLLRALGAYVSDKNDHAPMALIGNDAAGYWTRAYGLAPAATLIKTINESAEKRPVENLNPQTNNTAASPKAKESGTKTAAEAAASYFTNTLLINQDNRQVRFYDDLLKGKTVLINFMFTTCTAICPPMTANLQKVQQQLGQRVGRDIIMISLSVDPITDTPEVMKKYAANFKVGAGWYFITGQKQNVDAVLRKLGGFVEDKNAHSGILLIGNVETGDWVKAFAMSKPTEIADAVLKIADGK
jgi:cytochrome oxidase Cu insertion factor (SCO1/SenC/PrrC family)